ncbi:MAG: TIGR03936 family radical SAM-associated protein [Chloroflexota bacterium]
MPAIELIPAGRLQHPANIPDRRMRIRVTFSKAGPLIYIGNLDLHTMWERAARRADLPLAYSKGFHPQPKIHFAAPLPLGFSSRCELLDMRLNEELACDSLPTRLNAVLPAGIRVLAVEAVEDKAPALQTQVVTADYEITLREGTQIGTLQQRIEALLAAASLPRERRTRRYDLRPLIEGIQALSAREGEGIRIRMRLKAQEGATGRPDEVLDALGVRREDVHIERTALSLRAGREESNSHHGVT